MMRGKRHIGAIFLLFLISVSLFLNACEASSSMDERQNHGTYQEAEYLGPEQELLVAVNVDGVESKLPFASVWMNRSRFWGSLVFSGLLVAEENIHNVQADLCHEYAVSPDGLTYVFSLREDILWHDGERLTPEDVRWTIESFVRLQQTNGFIQSGLQKIVGVEEFVHGEADAIEGIQIKGMDIIIRLSEKDDHFLASIAQLAILPKHCLKETAVEEIPESDFWKLPVGTGPYKVVSNENEKEALLVLNEEYSGKKPTIKQIRFKVVNPEEPGDFDFTLTSDPYVINRYSQNPSYEVVMTNNLYYRYLFFNLDCRTEENEGLLDSKEVRQALMCGLDRRSIVNNIYKGVAVNIDCGIPEYDSWYVTKDEDTTEYRPARARQLLEEAGFDFDKTLVLTRYSSDELSVKLLEEVARCWAALGIETEIVPITASDTDKLFVNADWYDIGLKNLAAVSYDEWYYEYAGENALWSSVMGEHKDFDHLICSLDQAQWAYEKEKLYGEIQQLENELVYKIPLAIVPQYIIYNRERLELPSMEFPNMWFYYDIHIAQWKMVEHREKD